MLEITFDLTIEYLHSQLSSFKSRDWKKDHAIFISCLFMTTLKRT